MLLSLSAFASALRTANASSILSLEGQIRLVYESMKMYKMYRQKLRVLFGRTVIYVLFFFYFTVVASREIFLYILK